MLLLAVRICRNLRNSQPLRLLVEYAGNGGKHHSTGHRYHSRPIQLDELPLYRLNHSLLLDKVYDLVF